mgnify:FL=1
MDLVGNSEELLVKIRKLGDSYKITGATLADWAINRSRTMSYPNTYFSCGCGGSHFLNFTSEHIHKTVPKVDAKETTDITRLLKKSVDVSKLAVQVTVSKQLIFWKKVCDLMVRVRLQASSCRNILPLTATQWRFPLLKERDTEPLGCLDW